LAKRLPGDLTLTILRPQNTWYRESPDMIEQAAHAAVTLILAHQVEGTCRIAGYCFGGIVAFETARQLRAQGRQTQLILLDTPTPGSPSLLRDWKLHVRRGLGEVESLGRTRSFRKSFFNMCRLMRRISWIPAVRMRPAIMRLWRFAPT